MNDGSRPKAASEDLLGGGYAESSGPSDIGAERAVAGTTMLVPPSVSRPELDRLRDDDITNPRLRDIVCVERRMLAEGIAPDAITLPAFIDRHGLLEPGPSRTSLRSFVAGLTALETVPVAGNLGHYVDAVIVAAVRRRIVEGGRRLGALGYGADIEDLRGAVQAELLALLDALDRTGIVAGQVSPDA